MKLTDNLCRTAKANGRYQDFSDSGTPLTFRVKVNGEKLFLWRGRIGGKQTQRVIGSYPEMTLADARLEAANMKKDAKANAPTLAPVIHPHYRPKFTTLKAAAERYEKVRLVHNVSGDQVIAMFKARLFPKLGDRDIKSLTRIELNKHFNDHLEVGFDGPAINRYLANVKALLNWAVREDLIEFNPAATIDKKVKERERKKVISDGQLGALMNIIPDLGHYAIPLKLLLLCCCRRTDIFALRWGEVHFEGDDRVELFIETTKSDVSHLVPLSKQAIALLPERPENWKSNDRVFPNTPLSPGGKLLPKIRGMVADAMDDEVDDFTIHDFRTACTTWLSNQRGRKKIFFSDQAKDMLLAHVPMGVTRRHYDFSLALEERAEMLQAWADHLEVCEKKYPNKSILGMTNINESA